MATMQKMLFCLAVLATLALFTQASSLFSNNNEVHDSSSNDAKRGLGQPPRHELIHLQFQQLLNYLMTIFRSRMAPAGSSLMMMNMLGANPAKGGKQPLRREPQPPPRAQAQAQRQVEVEVSSSGVCDPPCVSGSQCCLLLPGSSAPSCHAMLLSGSECGWNHYTQSNPSTTVPLRNTTCPCLAGMGCLSATETKPGVCSFF